VLVEAGLPIEERDQVDWCRSLAATIVWPITRAAWRRRPGEYNDHIARQKNHSARARSGAGREARNRASSPVGKSRVSRSPEADRCRFNDHSGFSSVLVFSLAARESFQVKAREHLVPHTARSA